MKKSASLITTTINFWVATVVALHSVNSVSSRGEQVSPPAPGAGVKPKDAVAAPLKFLSLPQATIGGSWQLRWSSEAGGQYKLQRSHDMVGWKDVTTITATGTETAVNDTVPTGEAKTFWRVILLNGGSDVIPPTVSIIQMRRLDSNGVSQLELTVEATDNVGVVAVSYAEGATQLGAATQGPVTTWKKIVPLDPASSTPRQFQARANDSAGNTGFSDIFTYNPTLSTPFIPIDQTGKPLTDAIPGLKADGSLNAFTYIPAANGGNSPGGSFQVVFPEGGKIVQVGGVRNIEFNKLLFGFGPTSPWQFQNAVTLNGTGVNGLANTLNPMGGTGQGAATSTSPLAANGLLLDLPDGQTARLPLGELPFETVRQLLGIPVGKGIPLMLFGHFKIEWRGGTLTQTGVRGGRFALGGLGHLLPELTGDYADAVFDLTNQREAVFPIFGEIGFPTGAGGATIDPIGPRLRVSRARPLFLTLRPEGSLSLRGHATLSLPDGVQTEVDVHFDDPNFQLSLSSGQFTLSLLGALANSLPNNPAQCILPSLTPPDLRSSQICLTSFRKAYLNFIQATLTQRPEVPADATSTTLPGAVDVPAAILAAWGNAIGTGVSGTLPRQALVDFLTHTGQRAASATDALECLELLEVVTAIHQFSVRNTSDETAIRAEARRQFDPILTRIGQLIASSGDSGSSIETRVSVASLVGKLHANASVINSPAWNAFLTAKFDPFLQAVARQLIAMVTPVPAVGDFHLNSLLTSQTDAALVGLGQLFARLNQAASLCQKTVAFNSPWNTATSQVFGCGLERLEQRRTRAVEALDEAENIAALLALAEFNEAGIAASVPQGVVPNAIVVFNQFQALDVLLQRTAFRSGTEAEQFEANAAVLGKLADLYVRLPSGVVPNGRIGYPLWLQINRALPTVAGTVGLLSLTDPASVVAVLRGGIANQSLFRRLRIPGGATPENPNGVFPWETFALSPTVSRLAALCVAKNDWATLDAALQLITNEAEALELEAAALSGADQTNRRTSRRTYLDAQASLLVAQRTVALAMAAEAAQRRAEDPAFHATDLLLPGGLLVDGVRGRLKWNRLTGALEGDFGGSLRVPKLGSVLTVNHASINQRGEFDLSAHGVLALPQPNSVATLSIASSQPLHVQKRLNQPLSIAGRGQINFNNGIFVGAAIRFTDPIYTFIAETGGFETTLSNLMGTVNAPVLPTLNVSQDLLDYYQSITAWTEGFATTHAPSQATVPATSGATIIPAPTTRSEEPTPDMRLLFEAWAARAKAEVDKNQRGFIAATDESMFQVLSGFMNGLDKLKTRFDEYTAPTAAERERQKVDRLVELAGIFDALTSVVQELAQKAMLGNDMNFADLTPMLGQATTVAADALAATRNLPTLLEDPVVVKKVGRAAMDVEASRQRLGLPSALTSGVTQLFEEATTAFIKSKVRTGTQIDQQKLDALSRIQAKEAVGELLDLNATSQAVGVAVGIDHEAMRALLLREQAASLEELHYQSVSGLVDTGLSTSQLLQIIESFDRVRENGATLGGGSSIPFPSQFSFSTFLLADELIKRFKSPFLWSDTERAKIVLAVAQLQKLRAAAGGGALFLVELQDSITDLSTSFANTGFGELSENDVSIIKGLIFVLPNAEAKSAVEKRLRTAIDHIGLLLQANFDASDIEKGPQFARQLEQILTLSRSESSLNISGTPSLESLYPRLVDKWLPAAVSLKRAKLIADVAAIYGRVSQFQGLGATLKTTIENETLRLLSGAQQVTDALEADAVAVNLGRTNTVPKSKNGIIALDSGTAGGSALPPAPPEDMKVPGNLKIARVFGGFFYRRDTGLLRGTFGGRLEFPNAGASFDLLEATVANDGSFAFSAATQTPLALFGGDPNATLSANITAAGNSTGLQNISGNGTIKIRMNGEGSDAQGYRTFAVGVSYNSTVDGKPLTFTSGAENLFFDRNFAILNSTGSLTFDTTKPGATLSFSGEAGFFRRDDLPVNTPPVNQFWLRLGINEVQVSYASDRVEALFTGGTARLAGDVFTHRGTGTPATATLTGQLLARYDFPSQQFSLVAQGANPVTIDFSNFQASIPGLPDSRLSMDSAKVQLTGQPFPILRNVSGSLTLPAPRGKTDGTSNQPIVVAASLENWRIDGFPQAASISLGADLRLVDAQGFDLDVLSGSSLAFTSTVSNQIRHTKFKLAGSLRAGLEQAILSADPAGAVAVTGTGFFEWEVGQVPDFSLDALSVEGRFKLGGVDGVGVKGVAPAPNARLTLSNLKNIFAPTETNPFIIDVQGALDLGSMVEFGLFETRFVIKGLNAQGFPLLDFEPGGAQVLLGEKSVTPAGELFPVYLTQAALTFKDRTAKLFPEQGEAFLLAPTNLVVTLSGGMNFPPLGQGASNGLPSLSGAVNALQIEFAQVDGLGPFVPKFNVDSLFLEIKGLDIPPLGGITGGLALGNLNQLPDHPEKVMMAGKVGGLLAGMGVEVMLAASPSEFIGACFELNVGAGGIPIDGGLLGGVMLNGAKGGINFKNSFADPCDFRTYLTLNASGVPTGGDFPAPGTAQRPGNPTDPTMKLAPDAFTGFNCIKGPFPPPTVNPLCERHPNDPNRVIFKFSRLNESRLIQLGLTRATVPGSGADAIEFCIPKLIQPLIDARNILDGQNNIKIGTTADGRPMETTVSAPPEALAKAFLLAKLDEMIASFDDAARSYLRTVYQDAIGQNPNTPFYDVLVSAAAAGIPCFDVTYKVGGSLSHSAVASVINGEGAVTISTTGTAMFDGSINVAGAPVATGVLAFSLTNNNGEVDPTFGGVAKAGIGPLELGEASLSIGCPGCFTRMVDAFTVFLGANDFTANSAIREMLFALMDKIAPLRDAQGRFQSRVRGDVATDWLELHDQQKIAYIGGLLNLFTLQSKGQSLGITIPEGTLNDFAENFSDFVANVFEAVNPNFCAGGQVKPTLFGFQLSAGADRLMGAGLALQRISENGQSFYQFRAEASFSPTALLMAPLTASVSSLSPALAPFAIAGTSIDQASLSASLRVPALTAPDAEKFLKTPQIFLKKQTDTFFQDAVLAAGYQLRPLGLELANGQLRVIFPRLDEHPSRTNKTFNNPTAANRFLPYDPANPAATPKVATREDIIMAAVAHKKLQDASWRGGLDELDELFATTPAPEADDPPVNTRLEAIRLEEPSLATMKTLSLAKDYFPRGGIIAAGSLAIPDVLAKVPPKEILGLADFSQSALTWFNNAKFVFETYLADTTPVGQLAFYLPAPNPINFDFANGSIDQLLAAQRLPSVEALISDSLPQGLYNKDEMIFKGWAELPILGVPIGRAELNYANGALEATARTKGGTWVENFFTGNATFRILPSRAQSGQTIVQGAGDFFDDQLKKIVAAGPAGATAQFKQTTQKIFEDHIPRVSLEVGANVNFASSVQPFIRAQANANAKFFAFSPAFDPTFGLNGASSADDDISPYAIAQRRGGLGFGGNFQIGYKSDDGVASNDLLINISDASFAITPGAGNAFPALSGQLKAPLVQLPSLLGTSPAMHNVTILMNTSPTNVGDPFYMISGSVDPINFGNFQIKPTTGPDLFAEFAVTKSTTAVPNMRLTGDPAKLGLGGMGAPDLNLVIHGAGGVNEKFIIDTAGTITAAVTLQGSLALKDPATNLPLLTVASGGAPIHGTVSNSGGLITTVLTIPAQQKVTFEPTGQEVTLAVAASLTIRSDGFISLDLEMEPLNFGVFHVASSGAGGKLQVHIGSNGLSVPVGAKLTVTGISASVLDLREFTIESNGELAVLAESNATFEIPNFFRLGQRPGNVTKFELKREIVGASLVTKLRVESPQLTMFPGSTSLKQTQIPLPDVVEMDSSGRFYSHVGPKTFDLFGAVQAEGTLEFGYEPDEPSSRGVTNSFTRSPASLAFGTRQPGQAKPNNVTLTNNGTAQIILGLEINGTGAAQFHAGQSSVVLDPGQSKTVTVTFLATGGTANATLVVRHIGGTQNQSVSLSGTTSTGLGLFSDLLVSDAALPFDQLALGLKGGKSLVVANTGGTTIGLDSITLPPGFVQTGGVGSIPPGGTRVVNVTHQPVTAGAINGTLALNTALGSTSVGISGRAVAKKFLKQFSGSEVFTSVSVDKFGFGTAVDEKGQTWSSNTFGWAWRPTKINGISSTTTGGVPIKPKVLTATNAGASLRSWLVGTGGEYWAKDSTTGAWAKQIDAAVANPNRTWIGIARQNTTGTPLAVAVGNEGTTGVIVRETAPGTFAELTFPNVALTAITSNASDQTILAVGNGGKLLRSTTGGVSFSNVSVNATTANLLAVDVSDSADTQATRKAVVGGAGGLIFRSVNGGSTWASAAINAGGFTVGDVIDVKIEGLQALALDENGLLLSSADGGSNWNAGEYGFTHAKIKGLAKSGNDFWVMGEHGEIFVRIPDSGLTRPPLGLSTDKLDFGFLPPNSSTIRTFTVNNRGTSSLTITATPTESTMTVSPSSFTLAAGASRGVQATFVHTTGQSNGFGKIELSAPGFSLPLSLGIDGDVRDSVWTPQPAFTTENLKDVAFPTTTTGYAIGSSIFKSTNSGTDWTQLSRTGDPTYRRLQFLSSLTGWVVGGGAQSGRIIKTSDGGASWTVQYDAPFVFPNPGRPVTDISMISTTLGYATLGSAPGLVNGTIKGGLLRTANGGTTWTTIAGPTTDASFSGRTLHAISDTAVYVGSGGKLYLFNFTAGTWTVVSDFTTRGITDIFFKTNSVGWLVGEDGLDFSTTDGGSTWRASLETYITGTAERVHFSDTSNGRLIANSASRMEIWKSGSGGLTYLSDGVAVDASSTSSRPRGLYMLSSTNGYIVGDKGLYWRYVAPVAARDGAISAPTEIDFGVIAELGASSSRTLVFTNQSSQPVLLKQALIEDFGVFSPFEITGPLGTSVAAGGTASFTVTFRSSAPGQHDALLRLLTDAMTPVTRVSLTGYVQSEPSALVTRSRPIGLPLTVAGTSSSNTVTRFVRDFGAGAGELQVGGNLSLSATAGASLDGVNYAFAGWKGNVGATGNSKTVSAPNGSRFYEGIYRPTFPINSTTQAGTGAAYDPLNPPLDRPKGPWIRLTGAKLKVPMIDDFVLKGACYLSGERISASLDSTSIRVPESASQAAIFKLGSGSWKLDWSQGNAFKFSALSPSLEILGKEILPGATADLIFQSGGAFDISTTLTEDFQIGNGLLEIGTYSTNQPATMGVSFLNNNVSFNLKANIRALANGNNQWLFNQDLKLDNQATLFPKTFTLATTSNPIKLGLFSITSGDLVVDRSATSGNFSLDLNHVDLDGPIGSITNLSASVSGGVATFVHSGNLNLGPFTLVPTSGVTKIVFNVLTGSFQVGIPPCMVNAKTGLLPGWPSEGIPVDGFSFDSSGDFDEKLDLPSLSIGGRDIAEGGPQEQNFLRFKSSAGVVSFTVHDEFELLGNTAQLEFNAANDGTLTGAMYGNWNFYNLPLGEVSSSYDSTQPDFQFRGSFKVLDSPLMLYLKVGSGGVVVSFNENE